MRKIAVLRLFERSLKKLPSFDKKQLIECLEAFNEMLMTSEMPPGLGFKKINHDKYELRVNLKLRVVMKFEGDTYYLVFVGNHNDVKRYLRSYR